jgi:VWFA-related protein
MVAAWIFALGLPLLAQQRAQEEAPVFRTETRLALVHFHVVNKNFYVDNLKREDVILLEDGAPRELAIFEGGLTARRTVPVELMLLFDVSGSVMQEGLLDPLSYKTTLLDGLDGAKLSVYAFDTSLKRFCGPTRDPAELAGAMKRVLNFRAGAQPQPEIISLQLPPKRKSDPRGGTWIYEAVIAMAREAAARQDDATHLVLMFSDGFATTDSRPEDAAGPLRDLGLPVYPVVLGHKKIADLARQVHEQGYNRQGVMSDSARERLSRLESQEREILEYASLGELSGGRSFDPPIMNLDMVRRILAAMVAQVRCEYVAGFKPAPPDGEPRKHKLEVKLRSKNLGKVLSGVRTVVH